MLRLVPLEYWYTQLVTQFKERISDILQVLQIEKYIITNVQEEKSLYTYAQLLFCYTKAIQMTSAYN